MTYTLIQERLLAIVPKFTAGLGLPSGLFLIYEILQAERKNESNAMLRAVAGISFFSILDAFGWFMSTWFVPKGSFAYSAGNQASCNFQGFLLQVVIGAPLYNCALAYNFFMVVTGGKTAEDLARVEKYIHVGIISFAVFTSFLLLGLGQYNHVGAVCWVIGSPADCGHSSFKPTSDEADQVVPCDRGDWAYMYGMVLFYIPLWACIVLIIYFNASNYKVLQGTSEGKWYAVQSLMYCAAFCVTWAPSTTWSAMHWNGNSSYALDFASAFLEPLAAFWNLLIFLRNRPLARRKLSRLLCCEWMFFCDDDVVVDDDIRSEQRASSPATKLPKKSSKTDSFSEQGV